MAADKAAVASGADLGDGLRQRPVAGQANLQPPTSQPEDNKKLVKKVLHLYIEEVPLNNTDHISGVLIAPNTRPVGGCHCPADLYSPGYLHSTLQDWYQQYRYLG
jgi:hypothetical protein